MKKKLTSVLMSSLLLCQPVALAAEQSAPTVVQNQDTSAEKTNTQKSTDGSLTVKDILIGAGFAVGAPLLTWMLLPSGKANQNDKVIPTNKFYEAFKAAISNSQKGEMLKIKILNCARISGEIAIEEYRKAILCLERAIENKCSADELQSKLQTISFEYSTGNLKTDLINAIEFLTQNCMRKLDDIYQECQDSIFAALTDPKNGEDIESRKQLATRIYQRTLLPKDQKIILQNYLKQKIKELSTWLEPQKQDDANPIPDDAFFSAFQTMSASRRGEVLKRNFNILADDLKKQNSEKPDSKGPRYILPGNYADLVNSINFALDEKALDVKEDTIIKIQNKFRQLSVVFKAENLENDLYDTILNFYNAIKMNGNIQFVDVFAGYQNMITTALIFDRQGIESGIKAAARIHQLALLPKDEKVRLQRYLDDKITTLSIWSEPQKCIDMVESQQEACQEAIAEWQTAIKDYPNNKGNVDYPWRMNYKSMMLRRTVLDLKSTIEILYRSDYCKPEAVGKINDCLQQIEEANKIQSDIFSKRKKTSELQKILESASNLINEISPYLKISKADKSSKTTTEAEPTNKIYETIQELLNEDQKLKRRIIRTVPHFYECPDEEYRELLLCLYNSVYKKGYADKLQNAFKRINLCEEGDLKKNLRDAIILVTDHFEAGNTLLGFYEQQISSILSNNESPKSKEDLVEKINQATEICENSLLTDEKKERLRDFLTNAIADYRNLYDQAQLFSNEKKCEEECTTALSALQEACDKNASDEELKAKSTDVDNAINSLKVIIARLIELKYYNQSAQTVIDDFQKQKTEILTNRKSTSAQGQGHQTV